MTVLPHILGNCPPPQVDQPALAFTGLAVTFTALELDASVPTANRTPGPRSSELDLVPQVRDVHLPMADVELLPDRVFL